MGETSGVGPSRIDALDGLRAVAVTAVVLFHLDLAWMPGGFLGVSVFFTLSGFLIT
ncbi:MAG: acyltransferase family protein, partial [Actinomycetes bacterium]